MPGRNAPIPPNALLAKIVQLGTKPRQKYARTHGQHEITAMRCAAIPFLETLGQPRGYTRAHGLATYKITILVKSNVLYYIIV